MTVYSAEEKAAALDDLIVALRNDWGGYVDFSDDHTCIDAHPDLSPETRELLDALWAAKGE